MSTTAMWLLLAVVIVVILFGSVLYLSLIHISFTLWVKRWTAPAAAAASTCTGPLAAASPPGVTRCGA